ncbi:excisionase family DNA binding protein [Alkalibacillus filiformis]|uniref:Excisionase family DNA binding protein n=1 Tax=Alkalibacillus filiformis TaxID=200990 RepID=A0ABU0DVK5_9BACI|nr:helix-turn-helix domain-containing protein [Alkalibacillus filiformis]MDQ0352482.1 excisionase family DNA binding protein [Alkalibacillus filiformis]
MPNKWGLPDLLTSHEVADFLGVHINTVYSLCRTKELPSFKVGNNRRIRTDALIEFIEEQEQAED